MSARVSRLRSSDVVVGLLTENTPRMLIQAVRLLRSIRWFGGELAGARTIVCSVGPLAAEARGELESLGAEMRTVARFHPANPTGNRLQLIGEMLEAPEELLLVLDCDIIVTRDPLPYLNAESFQAKITPTATVSDEVFERLFAHFGLVKPPRTHVNSWSGTLTIPYFNAGVIAMPRAVARTLAPVWRRYNEELAEQPQLAAPCQRHMHQAALALAVAATGVPYAELPESMNYQINATQMERPPGFAEIDPVLVHYHQLGTDDGFLLPTPYPGAQVRIDAFHTRLRAEGVEPRLEAPDAGTSRPVVVLGMHRSGTSVVAELLSALGSYAGAPDKLPQADIFNPTGYWEHQDVVKLDTELLESLAATWSDDVVNADVSRLSAKQRAAFLARARNIVKTLQGYGSFVLKDPRMSLLVPLWREVLHDPVCVVVWREPLPVAQSLQTRDNKPLLAGVALWEHYNRTILRDTEGLPRVLVSYEDLLADPERVVQNLHDALTRLGVPNLNLPSPERILQSVKHDFNRSGPAAPTDETLLDPEQRALLASLRSGAVLGEPVSPTPARTLELLATIHRLEKEEEVLRDDAKELDHLLRATFASHSWRLGHALTGLLRFVRRGTGLSVVDRWNESKRRRLKR
jgi:hypothetical protein